MLAIYTKKSYSFRDVRIVKVSKHLPYFLVILLFSLLGIKALFHPGLFTAHDIWHQVARAYYYHQAVLDGQFPPYWISTLAKGLGYPLFFFSYHLPWLIGLPFLKLGFDIPTTLKILFFLAYLLSGLSMYVFVNAILNNKLAALLSSILYMWSPYHFLTIFVGASMGIVFVFPFLSMFLLGIHLVREGRKLGMTTTAIGITGIILSHLMHIIFLLPLVIVFTLWELYKDNKNEQVLSFGNKIEFVKKTTLAILVGILISSFYLIPAIYYRPHTKVHQELGTAQVYKRNFINLKQLVYSKWGFGPIISSAKDGEISFQLGIAQWILVISVLILLVFGKLKKRHRLFSFFLLIGFVLSVFFMLDSSYPIWQFLERFIILDFPFRFLLGATFVGSVFAAILLINTKKELQVILYILIIILALYTNRNHINVNLYTNIPLSTYLEAETTTNTFNEYLPTLADSRLLNKTMDVVEGEDLAFSNIKQSTNSLSFNLKVTKETTLSIRQFYFPGQTLYIDNKESSSTIDEKGRISFRAPAGSHRVAVQYRETSIIRIAKLITLFGILVWLFFLLKQIKLAK